MNQSHGVRSILRGSSSETTTRRSSSPAILTPLKDTLHSPVLTRRRRESAGGIPVSPTVFEINSPRRVHFSPYEPLRLKTRKSIIESTLKNVSNQQGNNKNLSDEALLRYRQIRMRYKLTHRETPSVRIQKRILAYLTTAWSPTCKSVLQNDSELPDLYAIDRSYIEDQNHMMELQLKQTKEVHLRENQPETNVSIKHKGAFNAFLNLSRPSECKLVDLNLAMELPGLRLKSA